MTLEVDMKELLDLLGNDVISQKDLHELMAMSDVIATNISRDMILADLKQIGL